MQQQSGRHQSGLETERGSWEMPGHRAGGIQTAQGRFLESAIEQEDDAQNREASMGQHCTQRSPRRTKAGRARDAPVTERPGLAGEGSLSRLLGSAIEHEEDAQNREASMRQHHKLA